MPPPAVPPPPPDAPRWLAQPAAVASRSNMPQGRTKLVDAGRGLTTSRGISPTYYLSLSCPSGWADGAGPRPLRRGQTDVPLGAVVQRRDRRLGKERGAEVVIGKGSQGRHDLELALPHAVIALDPPQRHHHRGRHADRCTEAVGQRAVLGEQHSAILHPLGRDDQLAIVVPAHLEFRLVARELHDFWHRLERT